MGLVAGAYGELSSVLHVITGLVASHLADDQLQFFGIDHRTCKSIFLQQVRGSLGLALRRGWTKLMLDRYRGPRSASQPTPSHGGRGDR